MSRLNITIDGQHHTTVDDDQEAAALLRLANRDPKDYDLFRVTKHGAEERIHDRQIVELKDGDKFVTRHKVLFTIDGDSHATFDDDQTADALLRLAGVNPADYDLARVGANGTVEPFTDDQLVKIQDGDQFVTAKHVGGVA